MNHLGNWLLVYLQQPLKVFVYCILFVILSMMLNGGFLNLWSLQRDQARLLIQIEAEKIQLVKLAQKLQNAKDPVFIERQAVDRYDLADEQDLVFVFADQ